VSESASFFETQSMVVRGCWCRVVFLGVLWLVEWFPGGFARCGCVCCRVRGRIVYTGRVEGGDRLSRTSLVRG
jgi:hypothetical protein